MFAFIGDTYINAETTQIEGLQFLQESNKSLPERCLYIDLGSFSTQVLTPGKEIKEFKNFFLEVSASNFPSTVKCYQIEDKFFLLGQDAIDFGKLDEIPVSPIFKDKEFHFNKINTFKLIEKEFDQLDSSGFDKVVISSQSDTTKKFLVNYFKEKEVIFVDDTVAQLNSIEALDPNSKGLIIDIGFETVNCVLLCYGLAFDFQKSLKGTKWVHQNISPTGSIDVELINKEIDQQIDITATDGANLLYRYFYETFFSEIFEQYLKELSTAGTLGLIKATFPVYLAGGALDFPHMADFIKEIFNKAGAKYNKTFQISVIPCGYSSLLRGLCSRQI